MRDFRDCAPSDGAARIITLISGLTVLQEKHGPLDPLRSLAFALDMGDTVGVFALYHELVSSLISSRARRVSGDLFMDYLISLVIEREHPFARMAADGRLDEAELMAMKHDLALLGELASLSHEDIIRMNAERHRELKLRPRYVKDDIAVMSTALWSGAAPRAPQASQSADKGGAPPAPPPLPPENEWLPFRYGERELRGEFVSDEALEEIYSRLLRSPDWRAMADDLWNLFASYGSGDFLRSRAFALKSGELAPMALPAPPCPISFLEAQRTALTEHVISFMRGGPPSPVLIAGPEGCGKTALIAGLVDDLPELRLVVAGERELPSLPGVIERLSRQPLRFILLLDGVDPFSKDASVLLCGCSRGGEPGNVLLAATAEEPSGSFPTTLRLSYPSLSEFTDIVSELIEAEGGYIDKGAIRAAAVDLQVDLRERLTMTAAIALAAKLASD